MSVVGWYYKGHMEKGENIWNRVGAAIRRRATAAAYDFRMPDSILRRRFSRLLTRYYNGDEGQNTDDRTGFLGYGLIHYAMVTNIKPVRMLCIGSRKGFVPAILALAARDNGLGHVDFVDASYRPDRNRGKSWGGIGFWNRISPEKHFGKIGVAEYISLFCMTSKEFSRQKPRQKYQYIYIDGDHSYEGVLSDYTLFWPLLAKGGYMVFHDVSARGTLEGGTFGVRRIWKELSKRHAVTLPLPEQSGLGILQKT